MVHQLDGARFTPSALPPGRVPVLFCADWCGYCHRFSPHFKRFRDGYVIDISDEDLPAWEDLDIHVVPTVIVFEDGEPKQRWAGVLGAHHVEQIASALEN